MEKIWVYTSKTFFFNNTPSDAARIFIMTGIKQNPLSIVLLLKGKNGFGRDPDPSLPRKF